MMKVPLGLCDVAVICMMGAACTGVASTGSNITRVASPPYQMRFDGNLAYLHVDHQVALGPRITGTTQNRTLGDMVLALLASTGWQTHSQEFTYRKTPVRNIWGVKGTGDTVRIVAAHYDTRRRADQDLVDKSAPVPGANDGASGVAVLLELARVLTVRPDEQVWLVFFDAEDNGELDNWDWIVGSRAFVGSLTIIPTTVIVVDMVGAASQEIFMDANSDKALSAEIWATAKDLGYESHFHPVIKYGMFDDHTPFRKRGWRWSAKNSDSLPGNKGIYSSYMKPAFGLRNLAAGITWKKEQYHEAGFAKHNCSPPARGNRTGSRTNSFCFAKSTSTS